ncbi:EcsC family protein [Brevibacillus sp. B_LB10_24]|uniref:EcsC family protein n=1 Tax=Brevibacillus sp. B_LB10_24 TaxID=3380645 RepID=UPI0038BDC570
MDLYEKQVRLEIQRWKRELLKPAGILERTSKKVQDRVNAVIPEKVHRTITAAVKGIVKSTLLGIELVPKGQPQHGLALKQRDEKARELLSRYKKIAAAEGAGTGAGGILAGMADFPALIAIKMKFLFELAHLYGFDTRDYRERLFLLYVFQLAFSSQEKRPELLETIVHWEQHVETLPLSERSLDHINWEQFQREYRDSIDFRKMLQLLPGIGAVVGAWANYGLLEDLGKTGMNCFRIRHIERPNQG